MRSKHPVSPQKSHTDVDVLRESIALMHAEIATLKASVKQANQQVVCLQSEVTSVKNELLSCANILHVHLQTGDESNNELSQLSKSVNALTKRLSKIDNSRNSQAAELGTLRTSVRDTALTVS